MVTSFSQSTCTFVLYLHNLVFLFKVSNIFIWVIINFIFTTFTLGYFWGTRNLSGNGKHKALWHNSLVSLLSRLNQENINFFKYYFNIWSELQSKVITDRIQLLEISMGNLCETFGKISRKNARLRDTTDGLVGVLTEYSAKEKINTSSKKGLVGFSSFLSAVEDYRHAMIERIEKKIIQPISKYQEYLKSSKVRRRIQFANLEK